MRKTILSIGAGLLLGLSVVAVPRLAAQAADAQAADAQALVAKRQALMKDNGKSLEAIVKVVKGQAPYGPDVVTDAGKVVANSKEIPALFPKDSLTPKSRAKPEIWMQWDKFKSDANDLTTQSAKLVEVAKGGDVHAIAAQLQAVGKTCGACHHEFRKPEKKH